jgi:hypothetical protein
MVARFAGIDADGRWNGCLRGYRTIDESSCGTNATGQFPGHVAPCVLADLAAGVYEMTSSHKRPAENINQPVCRYVLMLPSPK